MNLQVSHRDEVRNRCRYLYLSQLTLYFANCRLRVLSCTIFCFDSFSWFILLPLFMLLLSSHNALRMAGFGLFFRVGLNPIVVFFQSFVSSRGCLVSEKQISVHVSDECDSQTLHVYRVLAVCEVNTLTSGLLLLLFLLLWHRYLFPVLS